MRVAVEKKDTATKSLALLARVVPAIISLLIPNS
jgi:hypothetical protein